MTPGIPVPEANMVIGASPGLLLNTMIALAPAAWTLLYFSVKEQNPRATNAIPEIGLLSPSASHAVTVLANVTLSVIDPKSSSETGPEPSTAK